MTDINILSQNVKLKRELAKSKEYLDITDVTLLTGYSASTIRRRIEEGRLKCMQNIPNAKILFKRQMVEDWLNGGNNE